MQKNLAPRILIALITGLVSGSLIQLFSEPESFIQTYLVFGLFHAAGSMFVAMIKMLVVPLIFASIVHAVCSLENINQLGKLGFKTFALYLLNSIAAIVSAISIALVLAPGKGASLGMADETITLSKTQLPSLMDMLIQIIPLNPFQSLVEGNILQILFMAIMTGIAIKKLENHETHSVSNAVALANRIMMKLISMVMNLAPWGVFFLTAKLSATLDGNSIKSVMSYVMTGLTVMGLWLFVFYPFITGLITKRSPLFFIRNTREQMMFAMSTSSSNATIPITYKTLTENFHVPECVAGFSVPLGATINMSGSAIYMAVAAIFVANAYNIELGSMEIVTLGITTFLLAIATGGVPGGAAVTTGVILHSMGLPVEAMGIIFATDRIMDVGCTVTNVVGDTAVGILAATGKMATCTDTVIKPAGSDI